MKKKTSQVKKKLDRFTLQNYYPELPTGWGLYNEYEIEEKVYYGNFLFASEHYKEKYESGNEQAIITFVKRNPECFREVWPFPDNTTHPCYSNNNVFLGEHGRSWVIEQIERWRAEGTPEAKEKIRKLFNAYLDDRGKRKHDSQKDIKIYNQIKTLLPSCNGNVTATIFELLDINIEPELEKYMYRIANLQDPEDQGKLLKQISRNKGISLRKLKTFIKSQYFQSFNTYKEIYYKLKKLEETHEEESEITERNLRFQYILPTKDVQIPKKYQNQYNKEISLYCQVELLRTYTVSLPRIRSGIPVPSGWFDGDKLPIKKAIQKVSKEENMSISELTELYKTYKKYEALYCGNDCLTILKEL